jgi:uncharacterized membrane-anchored protein
MRTLFIIAAVVLQVGILAYMGGEREYVLRTGKIVYLRTTPVDPQDAFRGDYVQLDYEISNVPVALMRDSLNDKTKNGERVYAVLDIDENQVGQVRYVTNRRPDNELFIRGRMNSRWGWTGMAPISYGIEAYFVEQGKGREIEKLRGTRRDIQVPLEMETALGSNGIAVLKGYRCGKLGIGLEIKTDPNSQNRRNRNTMPGMTAIPRVVGAKIKLKNVSDAPLAVVDLPEEKSFSLEPDLRWIDQGTPIWRWVNENAPRKEVENSDVRVLQPQEVYEFAIDFNNPIWFVKRGNEPPHSISDPNANMGWGNNFRLVYRPPLKEECKHLDNADMIWHGHLRSSSFGGGGRID